MKKCKNIYKFIKISFQRNLSLLCSLALWMQIHQLHLCLESVTMATYSQALKPGRKKKQHLAAKDAATSAFISISIRCTNHMTHGSINSRAPGGAKQHAIPCCRFWFTHKKKQTPESECPSKWWRLWRTQLTRFRRVSQHALVFLFRYLCVHVHVKC